MAQSFLSRAWILAVAFAVSGCSNDSYDSWVERERNVRKEIIREEVARKEREAQGLAVRRLSALDLRFEKAEEKYVALVSDLNYADHPLKKSEDDPRIELRAFRNDLVLLNTDAEQLLNEVSLRMRYDASRNFKIPDGALQECFHLHTYYRKNFIKDQDLNDLQFVPELSEVSPLYGEAMKPKNVLYQAFGDNHFYRLDQAQALMDDYEGKIAAFEQKLQDAEPVVMEQRKKLVGPFLVMWDKKITLDFGLDRCRAQYRKYQEVVALHGIIPK